MERFTQDDRMMRVKFANLGGDDLLLNAFAGTDAVNELFRFQIDLLAERPLAAALPFEQVIGQPVAVTFPIPVLADRVIHGIVSRFSQGLAVQGSNGQSTFIRYRAEIVPRLWRLTKSVNCRIFQGVNVPDILAAVFKGFDVESHLQHDDYPPREVCTQYRESDFAFASRLMEEEGICFSFTHESGKDVLVLRDKPPDKADMPVATTLRLMPNHEREPTVEDCLWSWEKTQELAAGSYTLWDYLFQMPETSLSETRKISGDALKVGSAQHALALARNTEELEVFDYPGRYAHHHDAGDTPAFDSGDFQAKAEAIGKALVAAKQRAARLRMEQAVAQSLFCTGRGDVRAFNPGCRFTLASDLDYFDGADDYVLMSVAHHADMGDTYVKSEKTLAAERAAEEGEPVPVNSGGYANEFRCLPAALPYRPPARTPKPRIDGVQTAVVVGTTGSDVSTDAYGRVRVQFFWDRNGSRGLDDQKGEAVSTFKYWPGDKPAAPTSSCWVRTAQSEAGRKFGAIFLPRLGQEVVVGFQEGDPDRPVVLGSLYNYVNQPPFPLPENKQFSGWKTNTPGTKEFTRYNGLHFEDVKDKELVQLHATRSLVVETVKDTIFNVGGNYTINTNGTFSVQFGTLIGLQLQKEPPPKKPWQWTAKDAGQISASLGKSLSLVYGESTSAVAGLSAALTFGNKIDLVVNPATWLQGVAPNLSTILSPVMGLVAGRNEWVLGPKLGMVANANISLFLGQNIAVQPNMAEYPAFTTLLGAAAVLSTVNMLAFGGAGNQVADNWSSGDGKTAWSMVGVSTGVFGLALLGTMYYMMQLIYQKEAMQTAKEAMRTSLETSLADLGNALGLAAAAIPVAAVQPPRLGKIESIDGPYSLRADAYTLETTKGMMLRNVKKTDPGNFDVPGTAARITMSPRPGNGLQLAHDASTQLPKISLNSAGVTLSAGLGVNVAQLKLSAAGIELSFGPPNARASITLDANGITLASGPTTKLKITPTRIKLLTRLLSLESTSYELIAHNVRERVQTVADRQDNLQLNH